MNRSILILAAVCMGALVGCASATAAGGPRSVGTTHAGPSEPFQPPDAPVRIVYGGYLTSDPAPAGSVPTVDESKALAAAADLDFAPDLRPGTPTVTLRMVTINTDPKNTDPSSTPITVSPRLGWMVIWSNSKPAVHGPAPVGGQTRPTVAENCQFIVTVDATNGAALDTQQLCNPA